MPGKRYNRQEVLDAAVTAVQYLNEGHYFTASILFRVAAARAKLLSDRRGTVSHRKG